MNLLYRYTAGVVGGLSAVAVCAPSDRFLSIGGPLAVGLGVVFASSLGKWPFNTLWMGDADLRLYITTVQDG